MAAYELPGTEAIANSRPTCEHTQSGSNTGVTGIGAPRQLPRLGTTVLIWNTIRRRAVQFRPGGSLNADLSWCGRYCARSIPSTFVPSRSELKDGSSRGGVFYLKNPVEPEVEHGAEAGIFRSGGPLKRAKRIRVIGKKAPGKPPLGGWVTPALKEDDAGFQALFLCSPQPKWVFDPKDLRILEVNDAAISHYGYSREEFLGMSISDLRPQEDMPRFLEEVSRAVKSRQYRGE